MTLDLRALAIVAIACICTFATRLLPFLLFGRRGEPSAVVRFLGKALPAAVIAILIVYCVRAVDFRAAQSFLPQAIAIGVVALLHLWKRNNLISIGAGTVCYMLLVQMVF